MNNFQQFLLLFIFIIQIHSIQQNLRHTNPEAKLPTEEYFKYFNYPYEVHEVITEDGYKLSYYRIQAKGSLIVQGKPPVFLHHGLLDNSDTFIINSEDKAPAFILANEGFDVWMGNSRGNMHSRKHQTLNPDKDRAFWDFTYEEMSKFDLPAGFEYISKYTNFPKIDYIGHSQGSTIMFVALSERNDRIISKLGKFLAFGPVARIKYEHSIMLNLLQEFDVDDLLYFFGVQEVISYNWLPDHPLIEAFCGFLPRLCRSALGPISETNPRVDNYQRMDVLVGHDPAGTSLKNMELWKQGKREGVFQKYDYGKKKNKQVYGTDTPPTYDLTAITEKVYLFAGKYDPLADPEDVEYLKTQLKQFWFKQYDYGHCSFMWGLTAPHMQDVLQILKGQL